ncbi:CDGSH iron-sulfur domain-containing protein [Bacteroidales bacterium OttesenSCG-928-J19]|nr:CDGSH iron-sulfur domain-containing protein [Bacteroidales bacterium OttesenSCG-928-J19]
MGEPLIVKSEIRIKMPDGSYSHQIEGAAFCRCGQSKNQPFCDGSHLRAGFNK